LRIKAVPLTSGNVTPGKEQPGGTTWRWNGKPAGWPHDPATHDPDPAAAVRDGVKRRHQDRRAARIAVYTAARDAGMDKKQAAAAVGVSWNNAGREYESIYKDLVAARERQPGSYQPAPGVIVAGLHEEIASFSPGHAALVAEFNAKHPSTVRSA
jgi:hypothetical protein